MKSQDKIRIGTRESPLALRQAETVALDLQKNGYETELVTIKSRGDIQLSVPLYEMGIQGIFTKELDIALLEDRINIAVHSLKDVPTQLAKGVQIAAVLKRDSPMDIFVCKNETVVKKLNNGDSSLRIASSSIRRKAQWLHRYNKTCMENIRGNIGTRIQKLRTSGWDGALFAEAGLRRLQLTGNDTGPQVLLDWMIPAPAQGAIVILCREGDREMMSSCMVLNDKETQLCTGIERDFLRLLQGGCSTPVGALATIKNKEIILKGNITSRDGSKNITVTVAAPTDHYCQLSARAVSDIISKGGLDLLNNN